MMIKKFYIYTLFMLMSFSLLSQIPNGPGGVSTTAGSGTLRGWFESRDIDGDNVYTDNPANGTAVSAWNDKSGVNNHLLQTTATAQPSYSTAGTYPSVNFIFDNVTAANTDFMSFTTTQHYIPGSAFFVMRPNDNANMVAHILLDDAISSLRLEQYDATPDGSNLVGYTVYGVDDYTSTMAPNYGSYTIFSWHKSDANDNLILRQNNVSSTLNVGTDTEGIPLRTLGLSSNIEGANYDAVEFIVHNVFLSAIRFLIIENYLSSKYGNIAIIADVYGMDTAGNGDHDHDVAGIGRASSVSHTDAQGSVVRMYGASGLANGEYLLFGHNNGALTAQTTDLPTGIQGRWSRTWGVTETGDPGTIDVSFDLTGQGSVTASDLRLLIDTDNDGVFNEASTTSTSGATSLGGNVYEFANINFTTNTRFTLGTINITQTPLPIQLRSFDAKLVQGAVLLSWNTASETNNEYFTLERSTDGESFDAIATIKGAGNSTKNLSYSAIDEFPPSGRVYYRLKQTDFDGKFSYSKIIAIQNENSSRLTFFPHPVKIGNVLHLNLHNHAPDDNLSGTSVVVIDALGREITLEILEESNGGIAAKVPEFLPSGVYIMKIQGPNLKHLPPYKVVMTR